MFLRVPESCPQEICSVEAEAKRCKCHRIVIGDAENNESHIGRIYLKHITLYEVALFEDESHVN